MMHFKCSFDGKVVFGLAARRSKYNERAGGHAARMQWMREQS